MALFCRIGLDAGTNRIFGGLREVRRILNRSPHGGEDGKRIFYPAKSTMCNPSDLSSWDLLRGYIFPSSAFRDMSKGAFGELAGYTQNRRFGNPLISIFWGGEAFQSLWTGVRLVG